MCAEHGRGITQVIPQLCEVRAVSTLILQMKDTGARETRGFSRRGPAGPGAASPAPGLETVFVTVHFLAFFTLKMVESELITGRLCPVLVKGQFHRKRNVEPCVCQGHGGSSN